MMEPCPPTTGGTVTTEKEDLMTDVNPLIDRYIAIWNEPDPARRHDAIARTWTEDASYLDPLLSGDGHDGIDAMVRGVQEQFPGHRFRRTGEIDAHHDRVRFAWELVDTASETTLIAGVDFGVVGADGRLRTITGFLDQTPALHVVAGEHGQ